jgi:hypothetical protein
MKTTIKVVNAIVTIALTVFFVLYYVKAVQIIF